MCSWRGPCPTWHGLTPRLPIVVRCRRCSWRSPRTLTRSISSSGAPRSVMSRSFRTTPSTRSGMDRRCGHAAGSGHDPAARDAPRRVGGSGAGLGGPRRRFSPCRSLRPGTGHRPRVRRGVQASFGGSGREVARHLSRVLTAAFIDVDGEPIEDPSIVVHTNAEARVVVTGPIARSRCVAAVVMRSTSEPRERARPARGVIEARRSGCRGRPRRRGERRAAAATGR